MGHKNYPLYRGEEERVELEWEGRYRNLHVRLDDKLLGIIEDRKAMRKGVHFPIEYGQQLTIRLTGITGSQLNVQRNNRALPGSPGDAGTNFLTACTFLVLGFIITAIAAAYEIVNAPPVTRTFVTIVDTVLVVGVAALTYYACLRNRFAYYGHMLLIAVTTVLQLSLLFQARGNIVTTYSFASGYLAMRIFYYFVMFRGIGSMNEMQRELEIDNKIRQLPINIPPGLVFAAPPAQLEVGTLLTSENTSTDTRFDPIPAAPDTSVDTSFIPPAGLFGTAPVQPNERSYEPPIRDTDPDSTYMPPAHLFEVETAAFEDTEPPSVVSVPEPTPAPVITASIAAPMIISEPRVIAQPQIISSAPSAPDPLLGDGDDAKTRLKSAAALIKNNQLAEADAIIRGVLREDSKNAAAWFLISFTIGSVDRQIEALKRALAIAPGMAQAQARLSKLQA